MLRKQGLQSRQGVWQKAGDKIKRKLAIKKEDIPVNDRIAENRMGVRTEVHLSGLGHDTEPKKAKINSEPFHRRFEGPNESAGSVLWTEVRGGRRRGTGS